MDLISLSYLINSFACILLLCIRLVFPVLMRSFSSTISFLRMFFYYRLQEVLHLYYL